MADPLGLLPGFVVSIRTEAPEWGRNDCGHFVTRWAALCLGLPPCRHGDFDSEESFLAWIESEGGMLAYADRYLLSIGCEVVEEARHGDIGLVSVGPVQTMAIRAEVGWYTRVRFSRSMRRGPADPVRVWRVPCRS